MLITKSPNYEHMHLIWQQTPSHLSFELLQLAIPADLFHTLFKFKHNLDSPTERRVI